MKSRLTLTDRFMLMPSANATAKYAVNGELFAQMTLSLDVSEDTAHGRLILQNVNSVLIAPHDGATDKEPEKVKNRPFYQFIRIPSWQFIKIPSWVRGNI